MKKKLAAAFSFILVLCFLIICVPLAGSIDISTDLPFTTETELSNLKVSIVIMYDDAYHENVLLVGKELTLEITAHNTGSVIKSVQFVVGMYDIFGKLHDIVVKDTTISAGVTKIVVISKAVQLNIEKTVVYIWDNQINEEPYIALTMTSNALDYYGNDFSTAKLVADISKKIVGAINTN